MNVRTIVTALVAAAIALVSAPTAAQADNHRAVVNIPVTFQVKNLDRTFFGPSEQQTCPADPATRGATWTIHGHLVAPVDGVHRAHRTVTLYVHGLAADGDTSFAFDAVPGYNFALEEARAGHTSVVIDRVGYGDSTKPSGNDLCTGAEADMVHQVVTHLRAGDYGGPSFGRVALAGHSAGGLIAEIEAYTFHDVDELAVFAYADQGFTPFLGAALGAHAAACATAPNGYAQTFTSLATAWFSPAADPRVVSTVEARHPADPCGENPGPYIAANPARLATVTVPVLLVYGADDALFDASVAPIQASHFGSTDKTVIVLPGSGHALMLDAAAPLFRATVDNWLDTHGF